MQHPIMEDRLPVRTAVKFLLAGAVVFVLSGCAVWFQPWEYPEPKTEPTETEQPPAPEPEAPGAVVPKKAPPKPAPPPPPTPHIAIVLSNDIPAYEGVATELEKLLANKDHSFHRLDGSYPTAEAVFADIEARENPFIVAIGFNAARLASQLADSPVIFCQVFNFQKTDFHPDRVRGVSAIPPLDLQLKAWRELDPNLKSVGAILGDGHDELIAVADRAAEREAIEFHYRTARSDRETLYLFKRLAPSIDGFWLFPDNRVLSPAVIDQMTMYASRHGIQVTVFIPSMLKLGALMSAATVESDIAKTVLSVLGRATKRDINSIPPITQLSEIDIEVNDSAAQRHGLSVPVASSSELSTR